MRTLVVIATLLCSFLWHTFHAAADQESRQALVQLTTNETVRACRSTLRRLESGDRRSESNAEILGLIRMMRKQPGNVYTALLKDVLAHKSVSDHVKAEALRVLYRITGEVEPVRQFIESDNDKLRAAALDVLAPELVGDPSFDELIEKMMTNQHEYSQGQTGTALFFVHEMKNFKKLYEAEADPKKRVGMLVSKLSSLCIEPPATDEAWQVSNNAYSQYLLRRFKEIYRLERDLTASAITQYAQEKPQWKPLAELLIEILSKTEEAGGAQ